MDQDPRLKADDAALLRDPFAPRRLASPKPASPSLKTAVASPPTAEKLGLKLTGTLMSPGRRVALINGRAYTEGQKLTATADAVFVVRQIEERRVTLVRDGKSLVLHASKPVEKETPMILRPEP
jgi:hypothetical protein